MSRFNSIFDTILVETPKRAKFDHTHERKMTIPFGALIPTMVQEVLPGDSFKISQNVVGRFQALLAPAMHMVNVYSHYYYVPYRILNTNWTRFINYQGARPNLSTASSQAPYFTQINAQTASIYGSQSALKDGSLLDYLGFPTAPNDVTLNVGATWYQGMRFSALLPLAYQRIWSDQYRDQNFTRPAFADDGDSQVNAGTANTFMETITDFNTQACPDYEQFSAGATSTFNVELLKLRWRAWEKDYLTTALPYANQGIADPRVPVTVPAGALGNTPAVGSPIPSSAYAFGKTGGIQYPGTANNPTDLGGFTMSAMRVAAALKRWLENSARGGVRYIESLWMHWHVRSSDGRQNRSEYLGGQIWPMVISEVLNTGPATAQQNIPPGYMAGHGITYGGSIPVTRKFEEHGCLMAITSVLPRTGYLYSMPRAFMRSEPLDYAWPEFSNLGEQAVLGSEVMFKLDTTASTSAPNYSAVAPTQLYNGVVTRYPMGYQGASYYGFDLQNDTQEAASSTAWGWQGRFHEYRYTPSTVHGLMRSTQAFWHFGRMLPPLQALNQGFVQSNPKMDNFAVLPTLGGTGQYQQHPILLQVLNRVSVIRSLPYYNTPELW